jgi:hypothetical protein
MNFLIEIKKILINVIISKYIIISREIKNKKEYKEENIDNYK